MSDEAIIARVFKRFLTEEFWLLEKWPDSDVKWVQPHDWRFVLDGTLYDLTEEERDAIERLAAATP